MISKITTTSDFAVECALIVVSVFAALGPVNRLPNAMNRFAYSRYEALFAM